MRIAILGGTGDLGKGLVLRWSKKHDIIVGSRFKEKALKMAEEYRAIAKKHYGDAMLGSIEGEENLKALNRAEVIVPCISHEYILDFAKSLTIREDQVVLSPITVLEKKGKTFYYRPMSYEGKSLSVSELLVELLKTNRIVTAFQTVSAGKLADLNSELNYDILICGDDLKAVEQVKGLIEDIKNLKAYYVGGLDLSSLVECQTALLINLAIRNKLKDPSLKIV
ncbi:MAG: NADPH-dependent F420 reductase [Nitrososphaerales archaeon]